MYNQPFFIPNYSLTPNIIRSGMMPNLINTTRSTALTSRLGNIFSGIKTFNWSGLINNTSKTLGIINQTIPLVKQVGPMVGNMKSMIKLASVFKDETDIKPSHTTNNYNNINKEEINTTNTYTESPTFFIN
mgnify:CR=1 FL=1